MTYLEWLCGETGKYRSRRRLRGRAGSQKTARARELIAIANGLYVRNDLHRCVEVLKDAICLAPKNAQPYFILGLIFEEKEELTKAYYCFLVAAHLQKSNYGLWRKLYDYSRRLGYRKERIYFIEVLQRKCNQREMVVEKMSLYSGDKFKELSCRIELFEFDGADDSIFETIRREMTHRAKMGRLAKKLFGHLVKNSGSCSDYYMEQLVVLKYDAQDFGGMMMILDEHLVGRRQVQLSVKLKMIYVIASMCDPKTGRGSGHYDISMLLVDGDVWSGTTDVEVMKHLVEVLVAHHMVDEAVGVLNRMKGVFASEGEFVYWRLGKIFQELRRYDEALLCYNSVLKENPMNDAVKSQLHSIYVQQGNVEMAKRYETISQLVSIIGSLEGRGRSEDVYSLEMCGNMRALYDSTRALAGSGSTEEFLRSNGILVSDFLRNRYIFERRRKCKSALLRKPERQAGGEDVSVAADEDHDSARTEHGEPRHRLSRLHGLDVDEWFSVVTNQVFSLLSVRDVEGAVSLVFKSVEAHVFRHRSDLMTKLVFVGLKISLVFGEFSDFVVLTRNLILHTGNYSYSYMLFYFCNFFLHFHKNGEFSSLQKYLQRVCRRRLMGLDDDSSSEGSDGADGKDSRICSRRGMGMEIVRREGEENPRRRTMGVSYFLLLNSLIPNMLQSRTVETMYSFEAERDGPESIILASMFLVHSKSRRVSNRNMFVKRGIGMLRGLRDMCQGEDMYVACYNIGKAYQFFGFSGFAESFYLEALGSPDTEVRRLAQFNLYLIYKKNRTMGLFKNIVSRGT